MATILRNVYPLHCKIEHVIIYGNLGENMEFDLDSFLQITVPVAAMFVFWVKRLDKKFEKIDERFEKIDRRFEKIDEKFEKVQQRFDRIDLTLADHGERLSFLEAANVYTIPIEPHIPNKRSEIAKEMWRKRRTKKLENKS